MELHWPLATKPSALASNAVDAWAVPLRVSPAVWDQLWATLTPEEVQRAERFHFDDPRRRFVIARGTLRILLGHYLGAPPGSIAFSYDHHEKPLLSGKLAASGLHFNVSHSGDLALIAVAAGCELGIDVEQVHAVGHMEQIAERFFHPAEVDAVLSASVATRSDAFFRCWTAKEAVLKAIGTGIFGSLSSFQVPIEEHPPAWIHVPTAPPERTDCWLQRLSPCEGYLAAIAILGCERSVRCSTFSA